MEYLANLFAAMPLGRRRSRYRQLQDDRERVGVSAPPSSDPRTSLSDAIPSAIIPIEQRVRALAVGGAPAWSRRLRKIHELREAASDELRDAWCALALRRRRDSGRFSTEWWQHAERYDFARVNELIGRHNRHFPAEVNLPMDVRTRDYVAFNGRDYRLDPLDCAWILSTYPPDLQRALGDALGAEHS